MNDEDKQPIDPLPARELEQDRDRAARQPGQSRGDRDTHLPASEADELPHEPRGPLLEANITQLPPG